MVTRKKTLRVIVFIAFLVGCWFLFFIFALWAEERNLLSPEAYFLSFWAKMFYQATPFRLKVFFLTYPTLPFFLSLFAPEPLFLIPTFGVGGMLLASRWIFKQDTLLETLLFLAVFTSPLFLSSLCSSPILTLFSILLAAAFFAIIRHREGELTYCLFASGFLLGAIVLTYPCWYCILVVLTVFVLLFSGDWLRKISLSLVLLLPAVFFILAVTFLYWSYHENALGFLNFHPQSFAFYFRSFSLAKFSTSVADIGNLWLCLPFLWKVFSERKRIFWSLGALVVGILALPVFPLWGLFLVQVSGVLGWQGEKGWVKIVNVLILGVFVFLSWGKFWFDQESFFFHLYPQLEEKLVEYRKVEELIKGKVLVIEPAYFLTSSWKDSKRVQVPGYAALDTLFYDYLLTSEEVVTLPNFRLIWMGKELRLYRKEECGLSSTYSPLGILRAMNIAS